MKPKKSTVLTILMVTLAVICISSKPAIAANPVIALPGACDNPTFEEDGSAVQIYSTLTVDDPDVPDDNIKEAKITITSGYESGKDFLNYTPIFGIDGSYSNGVLTLSNPASPGKYQDAIQSVTFSNTSQNPSETTRELEVYVTDEFDQPSNTIDTCEVYVSRENDAPTDISLDSTSVDEEQASGELVGNFTTSDEDTGDSFTYTLVAGTGDSGNGSFQIVGSQLQTAVVLDYETQNSYSIRVRTTDSGTGNLTYDEVFAITVNDFSAQISIVATTQAGEDSTNGLFTLSTNNQFENAVTVNFTVGGDATSGDDYASIGTSVLFPALQNTVTIPVTVASDTIVEANEQVVVTLTGTDDEPDVTVNAGSASDTVTITDNDSAEVKVAQTTHGAEGGSDGVFTVTQTAESSTNTVLSYLVGGTADSGDDFTALGGSVTITAGDTTAAITVPVIDDAVVEITETVTVTLNSITSGDPQISIDLANDDASLDISDNDTATFTIDDVSENEDAGTLDFTLSLDYELDIPVDIDVSFGGGDAIGGGTDYTSTTQVISFAANDKADKTVAVPINNDTINESDETFTASLAVNVGTPTGTRSVNVTDKGTGTIIDNDYTITTSAGPNGSIDPTIDVEENTEPDFDIEAVANYCINEVKLDGDVLDSSEYGYKDSGNAYTYTFDPVTADHTLEASFRFKGFSVDIEPAGAVSDGAGWRMEDNDSGNYIPDDSWRSDGDTNTQCVSNFTIEFKDIPGWSAPDPITVTIGDNTESTYTGTYTAYSYVLTVNITEAVGGETVSFEPEGAPTGTANQYYYVYGDDVSLTAEAVSGSQFLRWEGDVTGSEAEAALTINGDKTVTAVFGLPCTDADDDGYCVDDPDTAKQDCDDVDSPDIYPGAAEICDDGIDQDCDGSDLTCPAVEVDADGDGYTESQGDCDDSDIDIHPGADEICGNGIDEDCYNDDKDCGEEVSCVDFADVPLGTQANAADPNIMFIIDDSNSMWNAITTDNHAKGGKYVVTIQPSGANKKYRWVYENDDLQKFSYQRKLGAIQTGAEGRKYWKSQWAEFNKQWYNPNVEYVRWPNGSTYTFTDADPDKPRFNPLVPVDLGDSMTYLEMNAEFLMYVHDPGDVRATVIIDNDDGTARYSEIDDDPLVLPNDPWEQFPENLPSTSQIYVYDNTVGVGEATARITDYETAAGGDHPKARWTPDNGDLEEGYYEVFYYAYPFEIDTYDKKARYIIKHKDETDTLQTVTLTDINQNEPKVEWKSLGIYYFHGNTTGNEYVQLNRRGDWVTGKDGPTVADAVKFVPVDAAGGGNFVITNSHYYIWVDDGDETQENGEIYLVNIAGENDIGTVTYYQFNDDGDNAVEAGELTPVANPTIGTDIENTRSYVDERQNFANWYQFYRRRIFAAKAAVGRIIDDFTGVNIGMTGLFPGRFGHKDGQNQIIESVEQGVLPVNANRGYLLDTLYAMNLFYGTPTQMALQNVGRYFDYEYGGVTNLGSPPYGDPPYGTVAEAEAEGGGCQRNFAIILTDRFYTGRSFISKPPPGYSTSIPLVMDSIGDHDTDGWLKDGATPSEYDQGVFMDDQVQADTLADIAMYYYENDLHTGLSDKMLPDGYDIALHQHMVTYTISFGLEGTPGVTPDNYVDADGEFTCLPECGPDDPDCPDLDCPDWTFVDSNPEKIDNLYHTAVNGRGRFLSAARPDELFDALKQIQEDIEARTGAGSAVSINAQELKTGSLLFQAAYTSNTDSDWTGDVIAKCLDPATGDIIDCDPGIIIGDDKVKWSAQQKMDSDFGGDPAANRRIITFNGTSGTSFTWSNLSAAQKALLSADTDEGTAMVAYLRGDDTHEAAGTTYDFRDRSHILGDFVHSSPFNINGVVYVGGNDGMLHAFDEVDGEELFAYIPNLVFEKLQNLTDPSPDPEHEFLVDNSPYGRAVGNDTLLVGGLGKGGKGYYCLDITGIGEDYYGAPGDAASIIKWEYPNPVGSDDDMGYSYSRAYIVQSNSADPDEEWVVIFGNGYESANGHAVLYILQASDGSLIKKIDTGSANATGYRIDVAAAADDVDTVTINAVVFSKKAATVVANQEFADADGLADCINSTAYGVTDVAATVDGDIVTLEPDTTDPSSEVTVSSTAAIKVASCNGLSTPALIDINLDGKVDYVYAGDLMGNLWKFDLTATDPVPGDQASGWKVAYADGANPKPLFQAKSYIADASSNDYSFRQPITTKPDVMLHCDYRKEGYIVVFGTGRYLGSKDYFDFSIQTIYGILDWADAWQDPTDKFMGYFTKDRTLSNMGNITAAAVPPTYTIDLTDAVNGDTVTITADPAAGDPVTQTYEVADTTDPSANECHGAGGLAICIKDSTNGLPGVTVSSSGDVVTLRSSSLTDQTGISITGGITHAGPISQEVNLLKQFQVYYQDDIRVLSDNVIDWFDPATGEGSHVGWYFDLPRDSERIIRDVTIRSGIALIISTIPELSPCSIGGESIFHGLNACTGGRFSRPIFDLNNDQMLTEDDLVNIGTEANPIWVGASGMRKSGLWYTPAIVSLADGTVDVAYSATSAGEVETQRIEAEIIGVHFWKELE